MVEEALAELVHAGGAERAAVVPGRVEHEVLDDELARPAEEVEERRRAARPLEDVLLLDRHHRQAPPVGVELVAQPRELLLPLEKLPAGGDPLVSRHHVRQTHRRSPPRTVFPRLWRPKRRRQLIAGAMMQPTRCPRR
jgi:hypothetical protein